MTLDAMKVGKKRMFHTTASILLEYETYVEAFNKQDALQIVQNDAGQSISAIINQDGHKTHYRLEAVRNAKAEMLNHNGAIVQRQYFRPVTLKRSSGRKSKYD